MVRDDVDVVHVGSRGGVGRGAVKLLAGLGEGGMESEFESSSRKGASHGDSLVGGVRLCVLAVDAAVVGGLGGDPWPEEWFVFRVVLLDSVYDGTVVKVGKGGLDVYGKHGVVCVVVQESLSKFVELFSAAGPSYCVLVWSEGRGYLRSDVFGDGGSNDPAWYGTARYGSYTAVRFE